MTACAGRTTGRQSLESDEQADAARAAAGAPGSAAAGTAIRSAPRHGTVTERRPLAVYEARLTIAACQSIFGYLGRRRADVPFVETAGWRPYQKIAAAVFQYLSRPAIPSCKRTLRPAHPPSSFVESRGQAHDVGCLPPCLPSPVP